MLDAPLHVFGATGLVSAARVMSFIAPVFIVVFNVLRIFHRDEALDEPTLGAPMAVNIASKAVGLVLTRQVDAKAQESV